MCKAQTLVCTKACGHYSGLDPGEACPAALLKDPNGRTPCDELINECELQRPAQSWGFKVIFKGLEIFIAESSSGHCSAWQKEGYVMPIVGIRKNMMMAAEDRQEVVAVVVQGGKDGDSSTTTSGTTESSDEMLKEKEMAATEVANKTVKPAKQKWAFLEWLGGKKTLVG